MGHGAVSLAVAGTANFLDFTTDGFVLYLFASSHPALFQVGCFFLALSVCVAWAFSVVLNCSTRTFVLFVLFCVFC